jgi:hypothetical protein
MTLACTCEGGGGGGRDAHRMRGELQAGLDVVAERKCLRQVTALNGHVWYSEYKQKRPPPPPLTSFISLLLAISP